MEKSVDDNHSGRREAGEERLPSRRSHQFRALSRRTATYHRRQWKMDVCCLGLCPAYNYPPLSLLTTGYLLLLLEYWVLWLDILLICLFLRVPIRRPSCLRACFDEILFNFRDPFVLEYIYPDESVILSFTRYRFTIHRSQRDDYATRQFPHRTAPNRKPVQQYNSSSFQLI